MLFFITKMYLILDAINVALSVNDFGLDMKSSQVFCDFANNIHERKVASYIYLVASFFFANNQNRHMRTVNLINCSLQMHF